LIRTKSCRLRRSREREEGSMPIVEEGVDPPMLADLLEALDRPSGVPTQCKKIPTVAVGEGGITVWRPLCKRYMKGEAHDANRCTRAHVDFDKRPPCESFVNYGSCSRGENCWYPHPEHGRKRIEAKLCVLTSSIYGHRLAIRMTEVLRCSNCEPCITGFSRSSQRPKADVLFFVNCSSRNYEEVVSIVVSDPDIRRVILTVFKVEERFDSLEGLGRYVLGRRQRDLEKGVPERVVRIQCFPAGASTAESVEAHLRSTELETQRGRDFDTVLDVVHHQGSYYCGFRDEGECGHVRLSGDSQGLLPCPLLSSSSLYIEGEGRKSRKHANKALCLAYFKLEEAIRRVGIPVRPEWKCVDIGAAPGGWSQVLCENHLRVSDQNGEGGKGVCVAVDPAEMRFDHPNLRHVKQLACASEAFLQDLRGALSLEGSGSDPPQVNMVVCDANINPLSAATVLLALRPLQSDKEFWAVISLKNFCGKKKKYERITKEVAQQLESQGYACEIIHLFANSAFEKTLICKQQKHL